MPKKLLTSLPNEINRTSRIRTTLPRLSLRQPTPVAKEEERHSYYDQSDSEDDTSFIPEKLPTLESKGLHPFQNPFKADTYVFVYNPSHLLELYTLLPYEPIELGSTLPILLDSDVYGFFTSLLIEAPKKPTLTLSKPQIWREGMEYTIKEVHGHSRIRGTTHFEIQFLLHPRRKEKNVLSQFMQSFKRKGHSDFQISPFYEQPVGNVKVLLSLPGPKCYLEQIKRYVFIKPTKPIGSEWQQLSLHSDLEIPIPIPLEEQYQRYHRNQLPDLVPEGQVPLSNPFQACTYRYSFNKTNQMEHYVELIGPTVIPVATNTRIQDGKGIRGHHTSIWIETSSPSPPFMGLIQVHGKRAPGSCEIVPEMHLTEEATSHWRHGIEYTVDIIADASQHSTLYKLQFITCPINTLTNQEVDFPIHPSYLPPDTDIAMGLPEGNYYVRKLVRHVFVEPEIDCGIEYCNVYSPYY